MAVVLSRPGDDDNVGGMRETLKGAHAALAPLTIRIGPAGVPFLPSGPVHPE